MTSLNGRVNISARWRGPRLPLDALAHQITSFADALRRFDPIFSEIAVLGNVDGRAAWYRQPLVRELSETLWVDQLRACGQVADVHFWNRRDPGDGFCEYTIHANDEVLGNGISMNRTPPQLHAETPLLGVLEAMITCFNADRADVYTGWDMKHPIWARHWRVWMREGHELPNDPQDRFQLGQGAFSSKQAWLGGTLYTWPEYAPWIYKGP